MGRAGGGGLRLLHLGKDAPAIVEIAGASLGQGDRARGAHEEPCPDQIFQRGDSAGYRRWARAKGLGGLGKTSGLRHLGEDSHGLKAIHRSLLFRIME